jgi:hypothetical protein
MKVAPVVTRVTKYGLQTTLHDGDDDLVDGHVRTVVGPSPVYLRFSP